MSTTKTEIERIVTEVDVLCELACGLVASYMPMGLGKHWAREHDELTFQLTEIPMRFKAAIEKAQRTGWAAE